MLEGKEIEVIDSKSYSFAIGIMVLKACKLAGQGLSAGEIAEKMRQMSDYMECYFVVDTLEYLKKGGRINAAEALIGNILNIKPFIKVIDGELKSYDKIRGSKRIVPRFIEEMKNTGADFSGKIVGVAYGLDREQAEPLIEAIRTELKPAEILTGQVGSVIGTHSGPGVFGVFFDIMTGK
jgi:DegV family protein with EDD domain